MFKYTLTVLAVALLHLTATAQTVFYEEPFDADLVSSGFVAGPNFQYAADGSGDVVPGWDNRSRIRSASLGGAALLAGPIDASRLTSPQFDAAGTELYLTFHHYLRSAGGTIEVSVLDNVGTPLLTQLLTPGFQNGDETSSGKFEIIDISAALAAGTPLQLEFATSGGAVRHWLLDDITVTDERPTYPTFPRYFGEQMDVFGRPYVTDSLGRAAVPFELVVDFAPGTTDAEKNDIIQVLGAVRKETCVCDRLEVWEMPGGDFFDPATGEPLGDPGEILERKLPSGSNGKVDNLELNLLNFHELQNEPPAANAPLAPSMLAGLPIAPAGVIDIAVLDTGVDLDHPALSGYIYRGTDGLDGTDDDENCYTDDPLGWNFVDGNNNPSDDHSHGTHVAGIVAQNLAGCENCAFRIIPYKTHDSYGIGTLFAAACATLQASVNDGAAVINASWGFYGPGSELLRAAVDTAGNYGTLVVAAVGNDSLNLVADNQSPATFPLPEIIAVGTFSGTSAAPDDRAAFSNYNPSLTDLFAPGIGILSAVPDDETATKTGTSMSTPAVAAGAALRTCDAGRNPVSTRNFLFGNAEEFPVQIGSFVANGRVLSLDGLCAPLVIPTGGKAIADFSICLLQEEEIVDIKALRNTVAADFRVLSASGAVVAVRNDVNLPVGEQLAISLAGQPAGDYFVVIDKGGRTLVTRLAKR